MNRNQIFGSAMLLMASASWATGFAEARKPEMFGSCLPWDGPALELKIPLDGVKFARARLWGKGIESAKLGGASSLSGSPMAKNQDAAGPGVLEVCQASWVSYGEGCEGVSGSVSFDAPSSLSEGALVSGRLSVGALSFSSKQFSLAMGKSSACGAFPR